MHWPSTSVFQTICILPDMTDELLEIAKVGVISIDWKFWNCDTYLQKPTRKQVRFVLSGCSPARWLISRGVCLPPLKNCLGASGMSPFHMVNCEQVIEALPKLWDKCLSPLSHSLSKLETLFWFLLILQLPVSMSTMGKASLASI